MYIKELEKNKYRVWVDLDPDYTGKRRRKSKVIQAKTKRELQAKINAWTESINNISECKTVSDMCNEVWPQIVANKSPNTVYGYNAAKKRIDVSLFISFSVSNSLKFLSSNLNISALQYFNLLLVCCCRLYGFHIYLPQKNKCAPVLHFCERCGSFCYDYITCNCF